MILPAGQTKGKIQSNGGTKEVKEESKKVERIVPIILNGREEGRSRSRERAPNPFLSGSKGSEGLKSKEEKERVSNGTSSSPKKIAPLATAEVFHACSDCFHTFTRPWKILWRRGLMRPILCSFFPQHSRSPPTPNFSLFNAPFEPQKNESG